MLYCVCLNHHKQVKAEICAFIVSYVGGTVSCLTASLYNNNNNNILFI